MKKSQAAALLLSLALLLSACGGGETAQPAASGSASPAPAASGSAVQEEPPEQAPQPLYTASRSELEEQSVIDRQLLAEAEAGYSFQDPFVVVNPYGTAPLSALVIFDTDVETEVSLTVKGHDEKDNLTASFPKESCHILPIHGLYAGEETQVVLELPDGQSTLLSIETEPVDSKPVKGEVVQMDAGAYDYSRLTFAYNNILGILAYDSAGDLRYMSTFTGMPLLPLANGHYAAYTPEYLDRQWAMFMGVVEIDLLGRIYNQYEIPAGVHHEIRELPNGNLLIGTSHDDMSVMNDRVVEVERGTGNIVWELDLCELMDIEDGAGVNNFNGLVWFHNNGFWYDEDSDCLLLSGRSVDAVVCVERSTKTVKWILGTPDGWTRTDPGLFFTPVEDESAFEWQFAQHHVSVLPDEDGNPATMDILLFDNGGARVKPMNRDQAMAGKEVYSRAVIYSINTQDMTVSQKWEYGKERGDCWYSSYIGGATYDADTRTCWVCSGGILYDPAEDNYDLMILQTGDKVIEKQALIDAVSEDGTLLYELRLDQNVFRCLRIDPYHNIQGLLLDLSVPGSRFVC